MRRRCVRQGLAAAIAMVVLGAADAAQGAIVRELPAALPAATAPSTRPSSDLGPLDSTLALQPPTMRSPMPPLPQFETAGNALLTHELYETISASTHGTTAADAAAVQLNLQTPRSAPEAAATPTSGENVRPAPAPRQIGPAPQVVQVPPVPEPSTGVLMLAAGLAAVARRGRRDRRRRRHAGMP